MKSQHTLTAVAHADQFYLPVSALQDKSMVKRSHMRTPRALISLQHKWILHNKILMRIAIGLCCAALIAGVFQTRGGIMAGVNYIASSVSSGLALSGLRISSIDFSGQLITSEGVMLAMLSVDENTSILGFDVDAARTKLLALPAIDDVTLRKIYPNKLSINIVEKTPFARWNMDGEAYLIDEKGQQLGVSGAAYQDLPLVIGEGASADALAMIRALAGFDVLQDGLVALSRIADRRWDLVYDTGLRVQLPEVGIGQALKALTLYQQQHQLLNRDLSFIDLRIAGTVAVRLTSSAAEAANKK